ncbi:hypothetical protein [Sinorhizobium alkalisoli]|uniref:hypothetical protein n=1 Tax=Sinorhizobium alkalisoli TaxID=1752398 RepID=UPI00124F04BA|nr:hypothetical protein [Sinorhizobium alkalisoli]QFI67976.1 hypothetical protein EKH55_3102 [Sinorhizobium alkalisoli]
MNGSDILTSLRNELASAIQSYIPPQPEVLPVSPWLAMSLLQKAIRRGRSDFALRATATLLQKYPDHFWRRCIVIAFEDVGIADFETVALVTAAASKTSRAAIGGEWAIASFLVSRLVASTKCRAADDLVMVAERHPSYERERLDLTFRPINELMSVALSNVAIGERALALWFAIGTERCRSEHLRSRRGAPTAVFDFLCETDLPHTVVEVAREAFHKVGELHCPLLPLLWSVKPCDLRATGDDDFPSWMMCGPLPSWAIDMFSREGRTALRRFLATECPAARWVRTHVPQQQQVNFLGYTLFSVESGLLARRLRWPLADELRRLAEIESQGPYCPDATEIGGMLRDDLSLLNEVRAHVL